MKVSILSIRVLFIALCILCAVNKVSFAQQRTLSFTTNSITPAASMVLPNKLALQNLPCGIYTSGQCDQATYKKFNLVYKLKVQDPDPTAAIYTVGRNAFNVTCTLNTKFVNCTTPANITQIDMGPTGGIQSTAIMNLSGNGINNPTTETILTIPFEIGGMNNNCFALLNTDYVQTTLTNVAITGINHNFVRLEAYIEEVNVTYTNIAIPVQTKPLPVGGSSKVNFAWKGCSPMFQLQVLKMYNIENSKLLENDINIHTDDYSYNSNSRSWFEALTINVIGNSKELTLVDGTGFYIWRVRALNNTFPGGEANPNNWGPWSSMWSNLSTPAVIPVNIANTAAVPSIFFYNQFDNAKNWIYTRNFIEGTSPWNNDLKETILGESIRYANGLGMVKQSQGFNNQANEVMVSETLQDYVGRDVMQTLPAASGQTKLGYIDNLLQGYNESNFDADATYKNVNPLPSNSIIAQYYSDVNTDLGVPNADGFAFTRTRFNRSPLNEVRESCLAGAELTMKTLEAHTNKIITGDVAEVELVRIFGEEAPNPANVMKNITLDANQTINVSYVDKSGKVIATCLNTSENPNPSLEPLASAASAGFPIEYYLKGGVSGADPYEIVETKTIPISKPTLLNFDYKLEQKKIEYLCNTLCTTCDYTVDFKVVFEDEPDIVVWQNSVIIDPTTIQCNSLSGTLDHIDFNNPGNTTYQADEFGNYIVTKTVRYHNNNAASIPYIDEYTNTLQQAIDASVYSASADWIVCNAAGLPITGLPQISIGDLSTKLSNKMMTGANGVYSMLDINPINNIPVVRILKKDPLVAGGQSPCDAKFSLTITPCPEVTCPDPHIFEDQLINMFNDALTNFNGTYPACAMSTNFTDHFIVYNQVYSIEFSGQLIKLDGTEMKTVIDNMIYDYNHQNIPNDVGKNYSCENILAAWEMAIEAYFSEAASICQNPTNAAVAANNDFLDKFFTTIGYRLVGSTHLPSLAGGYGYKTHPYRCFFMPNQWNPNPPGSNVFTYINANPSTAFSAAILNGNSLHNAAKPVTCPFLPLPTNPSDIAGYFDPNYGILDLQLVQPCDKSEATLLNFYRAIQYQLNANLFSVFGIPSGATYDNMVSLKQQNERLCRRICQANHDMYEDAITTEFAKPTLNNASVGLVEDYQVPLGYSSNASLLPARDNIAINWVETYTQMAVDNCKSKCNLTIQGTNCPGPNCAMTAIGTPEEQAEFMKATTMGAKIYLTTSFENVNGATQMPDREYWMSLYNDPCVSCMDFKGNPINGGGGCDENEVQNNTISLYPLSNIDGFLYKSCCPTLAPTDALSIYPMEHIDFNRDIISQNSYQSNYLAFSPDRETGVAYDLMPWLTQKLNAQIANGPATGTLNIYDMVYNYVNPVSDDLSASNAIAHTFSADDNAAGSEQLESDPLAGHTKNISYNNLGFDFMVGVKTFVTNTVTANGTQLTIKRTHSSQLAMHGYMKVKVEVTPPTGYVGNVTYKDILNDYTTSNHKIAFIIDNPREIYTSGNEVIMTKSFSAFNTKPLVLEYLVRIKKSNFSPFGTNEINNSDLLAITSAAIPLPNQAEYPVHYARGLVATSGAFVSILPAYEVNIPSLRIYNPQIKPNAQVIASFATGPNPEDDIQNAYTVTNTGIIPGNVPPEMSVNKYVQVVALSYNSLEVEIDPKTKNPKLDANGNPIVNPVSNVLWPYFNNHKVFQPASICMQYIPFQIKDDMDQLGPTSCNDALANDLLSSLSDQVQDIKDAAVQELKSKYYNICGVYGLNDEFKVWYEEGYHHYTLYYYNRAGNLIRTVAPEGVDCVPKANDRNTLQNYKQATLYDYNSLNQVVKSKSQDGGETQFIYDNLGRLRFSQNAKQLLNGKCSYMKYDELGRVTESGEHSFAGAFSTLQSQAGIITYPTSNVREIVRTVYTTAYPINYLVGATPQQNLLNRVSYTMSIKDPAGASALSRGEVVNVFSYDLSGNAVWTAQKIMDLPFNFMRYEFDMLSGAVLKTVYNEGAVDAYYHRYQYDANKKLLCVETSQDGYQWDKDARYTYYKHGPLKNTIIGHDKIQSVDYAYTINGWLKAINHPGLSKEKNADYLSNVNTAMNDVFATKIQYFPNDFTRNGSPYNFTETGPNAYNYVPTVAHDLYNGNISAILTSNVSSLQTTVSDNAVKFHVNDYHFDELHRLLSVDYGTRNTITGEYAVTNNSYQENFKYDANGNLRKANRFDYSTTSPQKIDDFEYNYAFDIIGNNSTAANNRLTSLSESGINIAAYKDIKQGNAKNYSYDAIGNLTNDSDEGLNVSWNVAGKVEQVTKLVGTTLYTYIYYYDAFGNRVAKSTAKDANPPTWEYYLRDAQGNIMANYARTAGASPTITTTERPIYGAARVGLQNKAITYFNGSATALATQNYPNLLSVSSYLVTRVVGDKRYELSDHLSNVRNMFTDLRLSTRSGTANPNYLLSNYKTEDRALYNYYAYGMPKTSKNDYVEFTPSLTYRYGFNGQMKTDELAGVGNHNTAMFWEYDTRLGRRWNLDPVFTANDSRYSTLSNNPIWASDVLGDFDSRKEARQYKKEHDLKGRIKKLEDGTFDLITRNRVFHKGDDSHDNFGKFKNDGVQESLLISSTKISPSSEEVISKPVQKTFDILGGVATITQVGSSGFIRASRLARSAGGVGSVPFGIPSGLSAKSRNVFNLGRINASTAIKITKVAKVVDAVSKPIAAIGGVVNILKDGKLTAGDAGVAALTAVSIACPAVGAVVGLYDIGSLVFGYKSSSDLVHDAIDDNL